MSKWFLLLRGWLDRSEWIGMDGVDRFGAA